MKNLLKPLWPILVILPCLAVFLYTHSGESGREWAYYYKSYVPTDLGVPRNAWDFRITELEGAADQWFYGTAPYTGWAMFWREAWLSWGVLWLLVALAWGRCPALFRWMFIVLFLGCFAACMVSHDKMRLWYRMAPAIIPMLVMWLVWLETRGFQEHVMPFYNWRTFAMGRRGGKTLIAKELAEKLAYPKYKTKQCVDGGRLKHWPKARPPHGCELEEDEMVDCPHCNDSSFWVGDGKTFPGPHNCSKCHGTKKIPKEDP